MKNIVLTTDFSKNSENAITYALDMCSGSPCKFILLHSYTLSYTNAEVGVTLTKIETDLKRGLGEMKSRLLSQYKDEEYTIETRLEFGDLLTTLSRLIREQLVDLVVVGATGESKISEKLFGSTTASIAKDIDRPVLVVPAGYKYTDPEQLVIAVDYEGNDLSRHEVEPLLYMIRNHHPEVALLHITDDYEDFEDVGTKLDVLLDKVNYSHYSMYDKDVYKGVKKYVEKHKNIILSMVSHKLSFFENIFHNSLVKKMSPFTKVPLLVMHNEG